MKARFGWSIALLLGLAVLVLFSWTAAQRLAETWVGKDIAKVAQAMVLSVRRPLAADLAGGDIESLQRQLTAFTSDYRIAAAALCDRHDELVAGTRGIGPEHPCTLEPAAGLQEAAPRGGANLIPLYEGDRRIGTVVLLHDPEVVARLEAEAHRWFLLLVALVVLTLAGLVLAAIRLPWRPWGAALRQMALGERRGRSPAFEPAMKDLRELLDRLAADEVSEMRGGAWAPERLKQELNRHLQGERIIVVANREPYLHVRDEAGNIRVQQPASGLVTALEPVMRACSGVWVAHGAGNADRETADANGRIRMPPGEESYWVRRVWLSEEAENGYYYGMANEGLWPLCHVAHTRPTFRLGDWKHYRAVNRQFADAVLDEVDREDPVILVQDYHFALLPQMLRAKLPRATIITFWHIPWPNAEQLGICPWRQELLQGLLGSSILGFHTQYHCNNFLDAADRYLESRIDREDQAVVQNHSRSLVRAYPISVEWPNPWVARLPPPAECRAQVFERLKLPENGLLGVGIDRLDYTKGIEERVLAVERLLERHPEFIGRFTFLQAASPSRVLIERYSRLNADLEELVRRVNGRFGRDGWLPIQLRREHTEPLEVHRYYRAADLCYVSSLHDGMNLVAKEFVAARDDERGVLVLSRFTGAARELTEALLVNPYDLEESSAAMATALRMPQAEQAARMASMRRLLAEYNVYRWVSRMLHDAGRLRGREQLAGHLAAGSKRPFRTAA